ncbi:MAG: hypothetical protein OXL37_05690 [Chloroflexota bacterium]|nr:hypothetical protein [Chloroflexota bacterium]MDE2962035.1 hypothetical protein [Chloroflexota bacterium]
MALTSKAAVMLAVFVAGVWLVLIGLMGTITADCPQPIVRFPEEQMHCTAFTVVTALGTLSVLAGAAGAPAIALYADIRKGKKSDTGV